MKWTYVIKHCEKRLWSLVMVDSRGTCILIKCLECTATLSCNLILSNSTEAQTVWVPLVNGVGFKLAWWKVESQCNTDTGLHKYPLPCNFNILPCIALGAKLCIQSESASGKIMSNSSDMLYNEKKRERGLENRPNWVISASGLHTWSSHNVTYMRN